MVLGDRGPHRPKPPGGHGNDHQGVWVGLRSSITWTCRTRGISIWKTQGSYLQWTRDHHQGTLWATPWVDCLGCPSSQDSYVLLYLYTRRIGTWPHCDEAQSLRPKRGSCQDSHILNQFTSLGCDSHKSRRSLWLRVWYESLILKIPPSIHCPLCGRSSWLEGLWSLPFILAQMWSTWGQA